MHRKISLLFAWPAACILLSLPGALAARAVTVGELQTELASLDKVQVIDVRATDMFTRGHIPGAINIPASLCASKSLPPLGKVVVCGGGLGSDATDAAAAALAAKPGISVEILEGGFAAWESAQAPTTKPAGMQPGTLNYIAYADLKAVKPNDVVLVDLRRPSVVTNPGSKEVARVALTDLAGEFPGMQVARSPLTALEPPRSPGLGAPTPPLLVLIDNGDGTAEAAARALKANGARRYVILAGGESILARHGRAGLQRAGGTLHSPNPTQAPAAGR